MPELDASQLQQLRSQLERRRAELFGEVEASRSRLSEAAVQQPRTEVEDLGELGEQRIRDAVVVAEQERDVDELRQIAAAEERIARGEYGECVDCGDDIPFERLQAQPAASRCVPCQEQYEQTHDSVVRIPPMS